jgi:hypothetical protein
MALANAALLKKELRQTLRGRAVFIMENLYLLVLVGVLGGGFLYSAIAGNASAWPVGSGAFWVIMTIQAALAALVGPSLTAPSITLEREQKTLDILASTPLRAAQIVWSKMLSSGLLTVMLILLSIPVVSICFLFGGISPGQFFLAYLSTLLALLIALSIGMYFSAALQRTIAAVPLSIAVSGGFFAFLSFTAPEGHPLGVLSPLKAFSALRSMSQVHFFRWEIPFWVPAAALSLLVFFWLGTAAVECLKHEQHRSAASVRGQFLALYVVVTVFLLGSLRFGAASSAGCQGGICPTVPSLTAAVSLTGEQMHAAQDAIGGFVFGQILVLWLLLPFFCAGRLTFRDRALLARPGFRQILSLRHWLAGGVLTGAGFLCIVSLVVFAATGLCVLFLMPRIRAVGVVAMLMWLAITLATIWALSALVRLPSFWRRLHGDFSRKLIGYVLVLIVLLGPTITLAATHSEKWKRQPSALQVLAFTIPWIAVEAATSPKEAVADLTLCRKVTRRVPFPVVTVAFYAALAALLTTLSVPLKRRCAA